MKKNYDFSKGVRWGVLSILTLALVFGAAMPIFMSAQAADVTNGLDVNIIAAPNLVVDSNVTATSTYAPRVATVIGEFCNTSSSTLTNVTGYIGDYSTTSPGTYPSRIAPMAQHPHLNSGTYVFSHMGGASDATRYMGSLESGQCAYQYWHFTYPACENSEEPPCSADPVWGATNDPNDDLWLNFDIWGTSTGSGTTSDNETHKATMRNEISAMANKIEPNGNPGGQWFNTDVSTVNPGETVTTNGILYRLGNINKGFDNDDNGTPDYNAWLQPFGDASYDPSCFRLIESTGVLTVTTNTGDVIIPFKDNLYFTDLPQNNTNVIGLVKYKFLAMGGACTIPISPYQEAASGSDNEKFNGDYGAGPAPLQTFEPAVTIDKSGSPAAGAVGSIVSYSIDFANTSPNADAGLVLSSGAGGTIGLVVRDTVPNGMAYVAGSAGTNNTVPVAYTMRFSTDSGVTWSNTDPGNNTSTSPNNLVMLQWWLDAPLERDTGNGNNTGTVTFQANLPATTPAVPFIENCADGSFADAGPFSSSCTVTMIQGSNTIGDRVWWDTNSNGIQNTGESGIDGVGVSLYYDSNGDGALDSGDVLISSTQTSGGGAYSFTNLANGDFVVVVDDQDTDITNNRLVPTTTTEYGVTGLGNTITSPYLYADFGFGPVLSLNKTLVSSDPVLEGQNAVWALDVVNTLPGDGTGQSSTCSLTNVFWANSGSLVRGTWVIPTNAFGSNELDGLYSDSSFGGADDDLRANPILTGQQSGTIASVEAIYMVYVDTTGGTLTGDDIEGNIHVNTSGNATPVLQNVFDRATLNSASNPTLFFFDATSLESGDGWQWSDFSKYYVSINASKQANADGAHVYLDGMGWRVTFNEICGGAESTVVTVPLMDEFDASLFEFVSANPSPDSVSTDTSGSYTHNPAGLITWDNLGPLFAGQTKTVEVTLKALEPTTNPENSVNYARVRNAEFANGNPVNDGNANDDVDIVPAAVIGDTVWNDNGGTTGSANNGVQDGDEAGLPGVTVSLTADRDVTINGVSYTAGSVIMTDITDENGEYLFEGLPDAVYTVTVDGASLPGMTPSAGGLGSPAAVTVSGATVTDIAGTGCTDCELNVDFGYTIPNSIFGNVWEDNDGDATQDTGENGIDVVTIYLCTVASGALPCNVGNSASSTTTDTNGNYLFSNLTDNSYYIGVEVTAGPVDASTGWSNTVDNEGAPGNNETDAIVVAGGNIYGSYDFGYTQTGSSSIGDTIFADWNANAQQDTAEDGVPGVDVYLYEDSNGDGVIDPDTDALITTDITDSNGEYLFENLPAGDYIVVVDETDLPWDHNQTYDPDNGVAGTPCGTCDGQSSVTVDGTSTSGSGRNLDQDFGYQPVGYGSIGDYVWQDDNGNGLQDAGEAALSNITVDLYVWEDDGDGVYENGEQGAFIATVETDANGEYLFDNLPAGDYLVDVAEADSDLPANHVVSSKYNHDGDLTTPDINNDPMGVSLSAGENFLDADFGFAPGGMIGDFVWQDDNGDGIWDRNEPGIDGVELTLWYDSNGDGTLNASTTTTTDPSGYYAFTNLPAGNYRVEVTSALTGYTLTGDPDAYATGTTPPYPTYDPAGTYANFDAQYDTYILGGVSDLTADFGYQPPNTIGQTVWIDSDGDGVRDLVANGDSSDEQGIAFTPIYLCTAPVASPPCDPADSEYVDDTLTDEAGYYSFGNLSDGSYVVSVDESGFPAGLAQTYDPDVANPCSGAACDATGTTSALGTGNRSDMMMNFGYRFFGSNDLDGTVWYDTNEDGDIDDGSVDPEEPQRYEDVTVYLWNCGADGICGGANRADDTLVGSTQTAADGTYSFTDLADGTYQVVVNDGAYNLKGTSPTTPTSSTVTLTGPDASATVDFGFVSEADMGDLPTSYNLTLMGANGPRHIIPTSGAIYLGSAVADSDPDGQESDDAGATGTFGSGDDFDGNDDDEGVIQTPATDWIDGVNGASVTITGVSANCTVAVPCYLSAWVDWDEDGSFSGSERVLVDFVITTAVSFVNFDVPNGTFDGSTYHTLNTRFRLYRDTTGGMAQPTGVVENGEVEDHQWGYGPNAVSLSDFSAQTVDLRQLTSLAGLALLGFAVFFLRIRRQQTKVRVQRDEH